MSDLTLKLMRDKCNRMANETAGLYHQAAHARAPRETLDAVMDLGRQIHAVQCRIYALLYPIGGSQ